MAALVSGRLVEPLPRRHPIVWQVGWQRGWTARDVREGLANAGLSVARDGRGEGSERGGASSEGVTRGFGSRATTTPEPLAARLASFARCPPRCCYPSVVSLDAEADSRALVSPDAFRCARCRPKAPTFGQQPLAHPFAPPPPASGFSFTTNGQSPLLSSSSRPAHHHHPHPHAGPHQPQPASFHAYRAPGGQHPQAPHGVHASPTFSDASTTVSPRDVFGDDHIMKKTYPSLFGRSGGNGPVPSSSAAGGGGARGTMDPTHDHLQQQQHGRNQVFHSPLSVDSTNTTSPRAIFAPLHTLRSTDSYLSTSSEDEDEVPSPIILPEPQPRPSTSAPHASSMHYHFGFGVGNGAGGHAGQASPAWSEGAGLGRELNKVDLGFRPLSGVDRFKAEETGAVAPSSRTVGVPESEDDRQSAGGAFRPPGPGLGKTVPGGGAYPPNVQHHVVHDDDQSTEGGNPSPRSAARDLAEPIDIDVNPDDIPTSSSDSDADDDDDDDAPYASSSRPKKMTAAAAAARRAALGAVSGRGGAARRGARGGKAAGLGRAVRGVGKVKGTKPRSAPMSRGVSKVRGVSASGGSSSGRASPSGEITYCPYGASPPDPSRASSVSSRLTRS